MHHTPWARGGLISDRVTPAKPHQPQQSLAPAKSRTPDLPKSTEIRRLEGILNDLASKTPRSVPGCFCLARMHSLSTYVPICSSCGLILCNLNHAHLPCPSCHSSLLTSDRRSALVAQVQSELDDTLAAEARERLQIAEAARAAEGAFPALHPATKARNTGPHKVLSLNARTGKPTLTTYRTPPASAPRTPPAIDLYSDRVSAPPDEVPYFAGQRNASIIWTDLTNPDTVAYVEKPRGKGKARAKG